MSERTRKSTTRSSNWLYPSIAVLGSKDSGAGTERGAAGESGEERRGDLSLPLSRPLSPAPRCDSPVSRSGTRIFRDEHSDTRIKPITRSLISSKDDYGSDDDLFGEYDSFAEDSSFLAQVAYLEEQCKQEAANTLPVGSPNPERSHPFVAPVNPSKSTLLEEEPPNQLKPNPLFTGRPLDSKPQTEDLLDDVPCSQLSRYEDANQNPGTAIHTDGKPNTSSGGEVGGACSSTASRIHPKDGKRKSLRDSLKNTLVGNAKVQTPQISRTMQIKETIILEELDVAQKTVETSSEIDLGPFYGLPSKVADLIEQHRGIRKLYDWQHTCLTLESLRQRKNLIYSLPTSGGKTLVAEIVILQELLCRKKDALMILPFVAIVQEKHQWPLPDHLTSGAAPTRGRRVPGERGTKSLKTLELHMLSEGSRGAILEMTLAKILYTSDNTQIIGMSATLNNVGELQQFLKADYYTDTFRPVELKEYVKLRDSIYEVDNKAENSLTLSRVLNYKYSSNMLRLDPDHIIALVTEVIPNHSCLVFCPTKKNCENVAEMICKYLNKAYLSHRETDKKALIDDLKNTGSGTICSVLKRTVPFGIAYHHSGLTSDERKLVEQAYSSGVLCLLVCTSTLAAGVNLPARRVVLRAPYTRELVSQPPENCYSNLMYDRGKGLQSLLLSLIGLKIAKTAEEIYQFTHYTLFSAQQKQLSQEKSLWDITKESLDYLASKGLVCTKWCPESEQHLFEVSRLGQATYKGSIDLSYSNLLYSDLRKGLEGLVLQSHLHLLYLVTPYDLVTQCNPDWMIYFRQVYLCHLAYYEIVASVC
ncbi:hypothetical protein GDO78_021872 [Eleutherodactylus coqui]|uniref:Helicase C-terminal domain-containing protein n=1 Tax=Eleutherodactylus coqui TaxID=57060 RepID=A0A8J6JN59_ELECQ|nr:hypothetical protein GDO78_021872 [Eleutherodactylus coqui]